MLDPTTKLHWEPPILGWYPQFWPHCMPSGFFFFFFFLVDSWLWCTAQTYIWFCLLSSLPEVHGPVSHLLAPRTASTHIRADSKLGTVLSTMWFYFGFQISFSNIQVFMIRIMVRYSSFQEALFFTEVLGRKEGQWLCLRKQQQTTASPRWAR